MGRRVMLVTSQAVMAAACVFALALLCTVEAAGKKSKAGSEEEEVSSLWFYGKLLLGLSPIVAIGAFAFCHRDDPEEEAKRAAAAKHCST
jgi:hypothetical protein